MSSFGYALFGFIFTAKALNNARRGCVEFGREYRMIGDRMRKGPFEELSRETIYQSKWLRLDEARVERPSGGRGIFSIVYLKPGTTVVALHENHDVLLVKEYKYAVERETIELVSGAIEDGETPGQAGLRELREETGYIAQKIWSLGRTDPLTTSVSCVNHILLAEGLIFNPMNGVQEDALESFAVPLVEAMRMVEEGVITHAASCIGVLRAQRFLEQRAKVSG